MGSQIHACLLFYFHDYDLTLVERDNRVSVIFFACQNNVLNVATFFFLLMHLSGAILLFLIISFADDASKLYEF